MDRLKAARTLLLAASAFSILSLGVLWLDSTFGADLRSAWDADPGFLHGMSGLSLAPSGSPLRNPEAQVGYVDLRFMPL